VSSREVEDLTDLVLRDDAEVGRAEEEVEVGRAEEELEEVVSIEAPEVIVCEFEEDEANVSFSSPVDSF